MAVELELLNRARTCGVRACVYLCVGNGVRRGKGKEEESERKRTNGSFSTGTLVSLMKLVM